MYNISHKYKRFLFLLIKLVLVIGAFYFIYKKLVSNQLLSFTQLQEQLRILLSKNGWYLIFLLLFTDANWLLEIYKWKLLASTEKKITFFEAYQQSLASLSASIITPNRIGEYGAKALFFKKKSRKKIMLLNFLGNMNQLAVTIVFGIIGSIFLVTNYTILIPTLNFKKLFLLIATIIMLYFFCIKFRIVKTIKIYLNKIIVFLKNISTKIYFKTLILSLLRYIVFSHQFYFLLRLFGVETDYFTLINLIFCVYFIASVIPSLTIFDWAIKGSVAILIFNFIELNLLTIVTTTTIMWILNFAFPALIGSIFVLNFKLPDTK